MKNIHIILSLLLIFACEDDKAADEAEPINLDGTYKLSEASMDCEGDTNDIYITIDGLTVINWDYLGDDCDDGDDCYERDSYGGNGIKDGNVINFKSDIDGEEFNMAISRNGTNGLEIEYSYMGEKMSEIYDYVSSEIKTYSPICN
tara:strand:- start:648 stop:1085 length:438 start_codon:yes stop_codon:yes gene_type:complete